MKKSTIVSDKPPLKHLHDMINELIDKYEYVHKLLSDQLQAVISHDLSSLNELIEKQVEAYENLKRSELKFKKELQAFHQKDSSKNLTLNQVLKHLEKPSRVLNRLRSRLKEQVEKTENLRRQLIDLLQFAQNQNNEMFQNIFDLASAETAGYNAQGDKQHQLTNALTINQRA